jgi:adenylate cyclase
MRISPPIGDQIAAALAQSSWFEVVRPEPAVDRSVLARRDENQFEDLDYVVDGAVSRDGKRAYVNVRLLDLGECARTVWSEHAVVTIAKVPPWSRLAALRISSGIDPVLFFFTDNPKQRRRHGATGLLLLAIPLMVAFERRKYEEAGRLIKRALEIEPDNAMAAALAAFWQVIYFGQGWTQNLTRAAAIAQTRVHRAVSLGRDDPEILTICGHVSSFLGKDYDLALHYFDRVQRLKPDLAAAWCWSAATYSYIGRSGAALERLERFRDLSSTHPHYVWTQNIHSLSYLLAGEYENAVVTGRRATRINPSFINESDREHYMNGLRFAGVPER